MSRGPQATRAELQRELAREVRQLNGLGASFFRAAAARVGVTVTDMQVIESLASTGPMTAGQLAELTGLTTGAITGMLNRLEETGLVRRERDPEDARRVIVRLTSVNASVDASVDASGQDDGHRISSIIDGLGKSWEELAADYDDEQLAVLVAFLKRGNALTSQEIVRLREAPRDEEGISAAPLGGLTSARLVIPAGIVRLTVRADATMAELYRAAFEGSVPDVTTKDGVVTVRYPRRRWMMGGGQSGAEITLNAAIPWEIVIQGGASEIAAELGQLDLAGLEVKGGMSTVRLELPEPSRVVPIRISGGASMVTMHRPAGVPARVHLKGWASMFVFDEQTFSNLGNDVRLHSPGYDGTTPGYDIEVASSVSTVSITSE